MAGEVALVMQKLVDLVEAATPVTRYDKSSSFRHQADTTDAEDLSTRAGRTRRFTLGLTGDRALTGHIGQDTEPFEVEQTFELSVIYSLGRNVFELQQRIAEDVDTLGHALMKQADWNTATTRLVRVSVDDYDFNPVGDEGQFGSVIVSIPIQTRYIPQFA